MKASTFNTSPASQRSIQQSAKNRILLLASLATLGMFSSCASDPVPEIVHPIPEPLTIPTPETDDDIVPDPVDVSDTNESGDSAATVGFISPSVIQTAKRVPGRPGFVFNPYNQNMVDVDGIPSGTKVKDPQDDDDTHVFKVP